MRKPNESIIKNLPVRKSRRPLYWCAYWDGVTFDRHNNPLARYKGFESAMDSIRFQMRHINAGRIAYPIPSAPVDSENVDQYVNAYEASSFADALITAVELAVA
jgi:hypothetical protein